MDLQHFKGLLGHAKNRVLLAHYYRRFISIEQNCRQISSLENQQIFLHTVTFKHLHCSSQVLFLATFWLFLRLLGSLRLITEVCLGIDFCYTWIPSLAHVHPKSILLDLAKHCFSIIWRSSKKKRIFPKFGGCGSKTVPATPISILNFSRVWQPWF